MVNDPAESSGSPRDDHRPTRWAPPPGLDAQGTVLEAVRLGHVRSRAEIVGLTGLSRSVVAQRLADLIEEGLIVDAELSESTGGRPPRRLYFNADAGSMLVADIGATSIDVALTDLGGTILASRAEPADVADGPERVLGRVEELFEELLSDARSLDAAAPWGIGIGVPGPVEFTTGLPVSPPIMPGWNGYPVGARFVERYGAPAWVDNDVNIMALGEWRSGAGRDHANMIFVKIGTGIGAGLIANGYLHRGARGSAGDVGHIQITDDPSVVCRCGNVGCLEALAGGSALAREAEGAAAAGHSAYLSEVLSVEGSLTARHLAEGAVRGDVACQAMLQRSGHRVGAMLAGVVNFFNPSLIVIGGGVATADDLVLAAVREAIYGRSLPLATRELLIRPSALGGRTGIIGAAVMVADELFSPTHLAATLTRRARSPSQGDPRVLEILAGSAAAS